jgi:hypothetical protein
VEMGSCNNGFHHQTTQNKQAHDYIMVVVDKITKAAHFFPVKLTHKETNIIDVYMREISITWYTQENCV